MQRKRYPSDLTDAQWERIAPLIPPAKPGGRPRGVDMREVLNGIFYVAREGVSWRALPHDLPYFGVCYWYHRRFQEDGTWETINDASRRTLRVQAERDPEPSVVIIDSQSVKTTEKGGGLSATMRGRRSRGGSGTSSSIRWACLWR
jgi:putative transposase